MLLFGFFQGFKQVKLRIIEYASILNRLIRVVNKSTRLLMDYVIADFLTRLINDLTPHFGHERFSL